MNEPLVVSQTFEQEHVAKHAASNAWFRQQATEAQKQGVKFCRYSLDGGGKGLLFEGWKEQPEDQGEQRWSFAVVPE
jgi:hypothetical protein